MIKSIINEHISIRGKRSNEKEEELNHIEADKEIIIAKIILPSLCKLEGKFVYYIITK